MFAAAMLMVELLAGWLLADLLSGLLHWLEDRYGREHWPVLGNQVIAPNRLHHSRPLAFTRGTFLSRNGTTIVATAIIAVPLFAAFGAQPWLIAATIGGAMANQVHFWAHRPSHRPAIVSLLQEAGFLQSPAHHQRHHAPPHTRRYCILTNWLNPILDRVGVWSVAERFLPARWLA